MKSKEKISEDNSFYKDTFVNRLIGSSVALNIGDVAFSKMPQMLRGGSVSVIAQEILLSYIISEGVSMLISGRFLPITSYLLRKNG